MVMPNEYILYLLKPYRLIYMKSLFTTSFQMRNRTLRELCLILLILCITPATSCAQSLFNNLYNVSTYIANTIYTDFSITGKDIYLTSTLSNGTQGVALLKIDSTGAIDYSIRIDNTLTPSNNLRVWALECTSDSMITLLCDNITNRFIIKVDPSGTINAVLNYSPNLNGIYLKEIKEIDGYLYAYGSCSNTSTSGLISKMDIFGNIITNLAIVNNLSNKRTAFHSMNKTADNGFIISGQYGTSTAPQAVKAFLIKTDSLFNIEWQRYYSQDLVTTIQVVFEPYEVIQLPSGGYMTFIRKSNNLDTVILIVDSIGNPVSLSTFVLGTTGGALYLFGLNFLPNGNLSAAGQFTLGGGGSGTKCVFVELDVMGNAVNFDYYSQLPGTLSYYATDAVYDSTRGMLLSGHVTNSSPGATYLNLLHTDNHFQTGCFSNQLAVTRVDYPVADTTFLFTLNPYAVSSYLDTTALYYSTYPSSVTSYCFSTGLEEKSNSISDVTVYPNPFTDRFTIKFPGNRNVESFNLKVVDLFGKVVFEEAIVGDEFSIDSGQWRSGLYLVSVIGRETHWTKKLIK